MLLNQEHIEKINSGMKSLKNFILEKNFLIDIEVLTAASKVLYLVNLIRFVSICQKSYLSLSEIWESFFCQRLIWK